MNKSSKSTSMVYVCVLALIAGLFGFWLHQRSQEKKDDDLSKMGQSALASGAIPKMQADADYAEGIKQLNAGAYEPAIMAFDAAIQQTSTDPRYFMARADAKERKGDLDGAAADRKTGLTLSEATSVIGH